MNFMAENWPFIACLILQWIHNLHFHVWHWNQSTSETGEAWAPHVTHMNEQGFLQTRRFSWWEPGQKLFSRLPTAETAKSKFFFVTLASAKTGCFFGCATSFCLSYVARMDWKLCRPCRACSGRFAQFLCDSATNPYPFCLTTSDEQNKFWKRRFQILKQQNYDHSMLGEARGSAALKVDSNRSHWGAYFPFYDALCLCHFDCQERTSAFLLTVQFGYSIGGRVASQLRKFLVMANICAWWHFQRGVDCSLS